MVGACSKRSKHVLDRGRTPPKSIGLQWMLNTLVPYSKRYILRAHLIDSGVVFSCKWMRKFLMRVTVTRASSSSASGLPTHERTPRPIKNIRLPTSGLRNEEHTKGEVVCIHCWCDVLAVDVLAGSLIQPYPAQRVYDVRLREDSLVQM